jgi:hypothetical protein
MHTVKSRSLCVFATRFDRAIGGSRISAQRVCPVVGLQVSREAGSASYQQPARHASGVFAHETLQTPAISTVDTHAWLVKRQEGVIVHLQCFIPRYRPDDPPRSPSVSDTGLSL